MFQLFVIVCMISLTDSFVCISLLQTKCFQKDYKLVHMHVFWLVPWGDILVNHYQIPHTLNEEHLNWYIIKFAAILKIQYSLSFRNINFLIALKMWFQDHLLISKCKGNLGNFSTYNWEYTSLLAIGNGAECGLNLRGLTALMYIWQHHIFVQNQTSE